MTGTASEVLLGYVLLLLVKVAVAAGMQADTSPAGLLRRDERLNTVTYRRPAISPRMLPLFPGNILVD